MKKTMKQLMTLALLLMLNFGVTAQPQGYELKIEINDLKNNKGTVRLELVDTEKNVVADAIGEIHDKQSVIVLKNLPAGTYAIRYFHDENGNEEMDKGAFGIPKEGYGFSNNARGFMGPPDLEDQLFQLTGNMVMQLKTEN